MALVVRKEAFAVPPCIAKLNSEEDRNLAECVYGAVRSFIGLLPSALPTRDRHECPAERLGEVRASAILRAGAEGRKSLLQEKLESSKVKFASVAAMAIHAIQAGALDRSAKLYTITALKQLVYTLSQDVVSPMKVKKISLRLSPETFEAQAHEVTVFRVSVAEQMEYVYTSDRGSDAITIVAFRAMEYESVHRSLFI